MLRIARVDQQFVIDIHHKLGGRGAYICKDKQCINLTIKKRLLNKSFKANLSNEIYKILEDYEQNN